MDLKVEIASVAIVVLALLNVEPHAYAQEKAEEFIFPVQPYQVTEGYSFAENVGCSGYEPPRHHLGEDVDADVNDPVRAVANGKLIFSGPAPGYGYAVMVEHQLTNGEYIVSLYGHLKDVDLIGPGTGFVDVNTVIPVSKRDIIGYIDFIPKWDIPHLHFQIRKGPAPVSAGSYEWVYYGYSRWSKDSKGSKGCSGTGEEVDFDQNGNYVGGRYTHPSNFIRAHLGPWIRFTGTAVATWFFGPKMCNLGARAYTGFVWTGCGTPSSGTCHSENTVYFDGTGGVTLHLGGYSLSLFHCINDGDGDRRLYTGGELLIKQGGNIMLILKNSRFSMDVDYLTDTMTGSGWATLDMDAGDESLRNEFNPHGAEQMELVFNGWNPVIQGFCGVYRFDITFRPTEYKENILSQPVSNIGVLDFPDAKVSLNVWEFTPGGQNNDMNDFMANQIMIDPGGSPPDGIEVISPYCYWELGTVLSSITADITFDLTGIPGTQTPANIRILRRENAYDSWEIYEDQELVDDTHIRANVVTSFSEWGIGFQGMIFQVEDFCGADFGPPDGCVDVWDLM